MKNANFLLSVVIPTRNRQEYAIQAIKQILNVTDKRTQIVVQDNSDDQSLGDRLKEMDTERITYNYSAEQLSFVDNFERATQLAIGEYVTLLGDDDGVLPSITKVVEYALNNGYDCITSKVPVTYYWPNSGAKKIGCSEKSGYIRLNKYSNRCMTVDVQKRLVRVLRNGCQFYHASGIPKIYHGIVRNSLLRDIRKNYGRLYGGLSPDIYSAFTISIMNAKTLYLDFPFTIDGNCKKSGAGAQAQGKHTGSLKDAPHLRGNPNYKWDVLVPQVFSIQTIWADSGLAAIRSLGESGLLKEYSLEKLCAYTILNNRIIWRETFQEYMRIRGCGQVVAIIRLIPAFITGPIPNLFGRVWRRVIGLGRTGMIINDVPDIETATGKICDMTGEWKGNIK